MGMSDVVAVLRLEAGQFKAEVAGAKAEMDGLGKSGASSFEKLGSMGQAAGMAIGAVAVGVGVFAVDMAEKFDVAHASMVTAFSAAGVSATQLKGPISAVDSAMEKFGYTNAETEAAVSKLAVAHQPLNQVMKDTTLAANIAAQRHIDLSTAMTIVTKAAEGNVGALRRMGIDLPIAAGGAAKVASAQTALAAAQAKVNAILLKTPDAMNPASKAHAAYEAAIGKVSDAQKKLTDAQSAGGTILEQLSGRFSGQAASAADTFGGKLKVAKAMAEDLGAKLGDKLIPVLENLMKKIEGVVTWFEKHKTVAEALGIAIGTVLVAAIVAAGVAFFAAFGWVELIVVAIAALVVGILYLATHWKQVWGDIKKVFDDAVSFLRSGFGTLAILITGPFAPLLLLALHWKTVWNDMKDVVTTVWNAIKGVVMPAVDFIATYIKTEMALISTIWKVAWDVISAAVKTVWDVISAIIRVGIDIITGIIKVAMALITGNWGAAWNAIKDMATQVWNAISALATQVWNAIKDMFTSVLNAISSGFTAAWNAIVSFLTGIWAKIKGDITAAWNAVVGFFKTTWDTISGDATTGFTAVRTAIKTVLDLISTDWSTAWNAVKGFVSQIWADIGSDASKGVGVVVGIINDLIKGINAVITIIPGVPSIPLLSWGSGGGTLAGPGFGPGGMKYHSGGVIPSSGLPAAGMSSNERLIQALVGEEVLTENDPRHSKNLGGGFINNTGSFDIGGVIGGALGSIGGFIGGMADAALAAAGSAIATVAIPAIDAGEAAVAAIAGPFGTLGKMEISVVDYLGNALKTFLGTIGKDVAATQAANSAKAASSGSGGAIVVGNQATGSMLQFFTDVLNGIGAPVNAATLNDLSVWQQKEGGWTGNPDMFNPWGTTLPMGGSNATNSAGVQNYPTYSAGLAASISMIEQGNMSAIAAALRAGAGLGAFGSAVNGTPWGTHFAAGGNVTAGVPAIVGEKGPELFVPGVSGSIIPNNALNTAMGTSSALLKPHGNAIMQGLAVGLQQGLNSKVVPLVAGVSGRMVAIIQSSAGISSPSTVFATQVGLPIAQGIASGITSGASATTGALADLLDQVKNAVANGQPEMIAAIVAAAHGMTTAWTTTVTTAGPAFDASIADLLDQVRNAVATHVPGTVAAITAAANGITQGLANGITAGTAPVVGASTALIAAATAAVGAALAASDPQLVGSVADLLDQVTNAVANGQPEIIAGIVAVAHGMTTAWTTAVSTAGPAFDASIADLLGQVKNAVANGQPGIVAAITAAATGIAAAATAAVLPAYNATTSGQLGIIGNGFGIGATAPLSLPAFASGGNVTAGMPAIVGEKGPERFVPWANGSIIPNNALNTSGGGAGGVNATFNLTFNDVGLDTRQVVREEMGVVIVELDHLIKARGR
jgi:phage-related protein